MNRLLEIPSIRKDIKISFKRLFDFEFQERTNWIDPNYKHSFWDSLYYHVFEFLFDQIGLSGEAEQSIGISLYNKEEADRIDEFLEFFNEIFEGEMPDEYYVNHPLWPKLINDAKALVQMMEENNKKFNFDADVEDYEEEHKDDFIIPGQESL